MFFDKYCTCVWHTSRMCLYIYMYMYACTGIIHVDVVYTPCRLETMCQCHGYTLYMYGDGVVVYLCTEEQCLH